MQHIELHPEALHELEEAHIWYKGKSARLGERFLDELDRAMAAIQQSPDRWPTFVGGTRRFLLHRFPFAVVYRKTDNNIQVIAVMHQRRNPGYWKKRM
ncbi:MAG: type II toxin-antitoxin system RelE/ParE family toxin [Bacteroidota bacterium]